MSELLTPHGEALLAQFQEQRPQLEELSRKIIDQLRQLLDEQGIECNAIECRVKTVSSLAGKLMRKGDKYASLYDVTDLIGLRVVTFYTDDVDKVAAIVSRHFYVDYSNSVDKRKLHQLNSFGYSSLHYVCRMPGSDVPFELQMRTALQHVWSAIEHDIGYKGAVKLPPEYRRQFSRLAGMLELVDDEFSRLRTTMTDYRRHVQSLVKSGRLEEVPLSAESFSSYLESHPFERLNRRIAAVNQAELFSASLLPFLPVLEHFGLETLGDVEHFIAENTEDAYRLAIMQLAVTELDILSSAIGLQNLCLVHALKCGEGRVGLHFVFDTINGRHASNDMLVDMVLQQATNLPSFAPQNN